MSAVYTTTFENDIKRIKKQGYDTSKLRRLIIKLHDKRKLYKGHRDHKLRGKLQGCRECRVEPDNDDWLLIYRYEKLDLILERTGSHSELFNKI